jgi:hypothetical protein
MALRYSAKEQLRPSMLPHDKKRKVLSRVKKIENFIIPRGDGANTVGALRKAIAAESAELAKLSDSLAPILRTSLVINNRESAMKSRYERFVKTFPKISTLLTLKRVMDSTDPLDFCKTYLNINANSSAADKNPKYCLLRELTNGFLEYQKLFGFSSEIEAIRHWSANVDLANLEKDLIGKRRGVGPAVVQNIKLNLGESVGKMDRHVIGVMKKFLKLEDSVLDRYEEFARFIGKEPRYLDYILFKYGQAKNISA